MIRATVGILAGVGGGFDADYQAVLDYATTQTYTLPSESQQALQNQLVVDLKDAGVWSKLDLLYVFATDGDREYAAINWKDPNSHEITEVNSPTFTTNEGFAQSGTASLDTSFVIDTNGTNYTRDHAGLFCAFPTLSSTSLSNNSPFGTDITTNYLRTRLDLNDTVIQNRLWLNSTTSIDNYRIYKVNDSIHFYNRESSTIVSQRNTDLLNLLTSTSTGSASSEALLNEELVLLRASNRYFETTANMGLFGLGSSLTTTEMEDIESSWYTNYFTNL